MGNLGKIENGIVSVNAYGLLDGIIFLLLFKVFKPKSRLQAEDTYRSKPELAVELIEELQAHGFRFSVVLADNLYGERSDFIAGLEKLKLKYVLAIRSNHAVRLPGEQKRSIREIVYGQRRRLRYYQITSDKQSLPAESTCYVMTNLEGNIKKRVGNIYGLRTWIEYGFKQIKNELGRADYRLTDYAAIERW